MHIKALAIILFVFAWLLPAHATTTNTIEGAGISGGAALTTALSRADAALAQSMLNTNIIKGELGEVITSDFLSKTSKGGWAEVTPRIGRQGIDHIYIKFNNKGEPRGLIVGETKVNTSTLSVTKKDGLQMSNRWTNNRLIEPGNLYQRIAAERVQVIKPPVLPPKQSVKIPLPNDETGVFWRESEHEPWKYSGPKDSLSEAQKKAKTIGIYLTSAGKGNITYRQRLFNVKLNGNNVSITISTLDNGKIVGPSETIDLGDISNFSSAKEMNSIVAKAFKKKFPELSDKECLEMAKKTDVLKVIQQQRYDLAMRTLQTSFYAALFAIGIDVGLQLFTNNGQINNINWGKTAFTGGVALVSTGIGQLASMSLLYYSTGRTAISSISSSLNISNSLTRNLIGGGITGVVTSILYGYGGYLLGYHSMKDANIIATVGVGSTLSGVAFTAGVSSLVATFGTASTGVAISSLSGAAATNATMAFLGGGSIAAGGGGVAVGTAVLSGGAIIVVIAVGYIGSQAVVVWLDHQSRKEQITFLNDFINNGTTQNNFMGKYFPKEASI